MITIVETCIYAENLDETIRFYEDVLDLPLIAFEEDRHAFFKCGKGMLLIFDPNHTSRVQTEVSGSPVPLHGAKGENHVAFSVKDSEYENWKQNLIDNGVAIESVVKWPNGVDSFYFRDPAGNSLEIIRGALWNLESEKKTQK